MTEADLRALNILMDIVEGVEPIAVFTSEDPRQTGNEIFRRSPGMKAQIIFTEPEKIKVSTHLYQHDIYAITDILKGEVNYVSWIFPIAFGDNMIVLHIESVKDSETFKENTEVTEYVVLKYCPLPAVLHRAENEFLYRWR